VNEVEVNFLQFDENWEYWQIVYYFRTILSVDFCRTEITTWRKFIFEKLKVTLLGSSSPFLKLAHFHYRVWETPPSVPMQVEKFLSQFHFLNSLKTHF